MKFKINENVFVFTAGKYKTILDSETIADIELYYMSDGTAYPLDDLAPIETCEDVLLNMDFNIKDLLIGLD